MERKFDKLDILVMNALSISKTAKVVVDRLEFNGNLRTVIVRYDFNGELWLYQSSYTFADDGASDDLVETDVDMIRLTSDLLIDWR